MSDGDIAESSVLCFARQFLCCLIFFLSTESTAFNLCNKDVYLKKEKKKRKWRVVEEEQCCLCSAYPVCLLWKHLRAGFGFILCLHSTKHASFAASLQFDPVYYHQLKALCLLLLILNNSYFFKGTAIIPFSLGQKGHK